MYAIYVYIATPFTILASIALLIAIFHFSKRKDDKKVNIFSVLLALLICVYILAIFLDQSILMIWIWAIMIVFGGG